MPWMLTFSVRHDCFGPLGLTITKAAEPLGDAAHPQQFSQRQERHFGGYGDPSRQGIRRRHGMWLRLQIACDLAQARQHEADIDVKPVSRRKLDEPHLCAAAPEFWTAR
jgi:hypothetical protein